MNSRFAVLGFLLFGLCLAYADPIKSCVNDCIKRNRDILNNDKVDFNLKDCARLCKGNSILFNLDKINNGLIHIDNVRNCDKSCKNNSRDYAEEIECNKFCYKNVVNRCVRQCNDVHNDKDWCKKICVINHLRRNNIDDDFFKNVNNDYVFKNNNNNDDFLNNNDFDNNNDDGLNNNNNNNNDVKKCIRACDLIRDNVNNGKCIRKCNDFGNDSDAVNVFYDIYNDDDFKQCDKNCRNDARNYFDKAKCFKSCDKKVIKRCFNACKNNDNDSKWCNKVCGDALIHHVNVNDFIDVINSINDDIYNEISNNLNNGNNDIDRRINNNLNNDIFNNNDVCVRNCKNNVFVNSRDNVLLRNCVRSCRN